MGCVSDCWLPNCVLASQLRKHIAETAELGGTFRDRHLSQRGSSDLPLHPFDPLWGVHRHRVQVSPFIWATQRWANLSRSDLGRPLLHASHRLTGWLSMLLMAALGCRL